MTGRHLLPLSTPTDDDAFKQVCIVYVTSSQTQLTGVIPSAKTSLAFVFQKWLTLSLLDYPVGVNLVVLDPIPKGDKCLKREDKNVAIYCSCAAILT